MSATRTGGLALARMPSAEHGNAREYQRDFSTGAEVALTGQCR